MAGKKKLPPGRTDSRVDAERVKQALQSGVGMVRGLTAPVLAHDLEMFSLGYLRQMAMRWSLIRERDDTIKAVAEKRELDAALLEWEVLTLDDSPEAAAHQSALEDFYNGLVATHVLDQNQRGGVSGLIRQMMRCMGDKYAVHEIVWRPAPTGLTAEFRYCPLQFFENTTGRLRFLAQDNVYPGEELEEGGWMVTVGSGLMEATSIAYLFKNLPLKSWLTFCDKYGLPGLHGETTAAPGSEEWNRFRDALGSFAQDWALLTSAGGKINPIEINASGTSPHKDLVDRMDRAISRLWRGADLGTMSQDGAAVGSNPQESETDILSAADALVITETLQHYVDAFVIRYRFGVEPKAYFKLQPKTKVNQELELKIDEALVRWGVPRSKRELLARYGRPEAEAGEELASEPQPAPVNPLGNERRAQRAEFVARATAELDAAQRELLSPVLVRLARIEQIADPVAQRAALEQFQATLPATGREIVRRAPALAPVFEKIIGPALADGFAAAAAKPSKS